MLTACVATVLIGAMRLDSWAALSIVPGAWYVSCVGWRSFGLIVGVSCLFVFLGRARRVELSSCNTSRMRIHIFSSFQCHCFSVTTDTIAWTSA